jgi:hypothetical protein
MSIVSKEEQLEDQSQRGWEELSPVPGRVMAQPERLHAS